LARGRVVLEDRVRGGDDERDARHPPVADDPGRQRAEGADDDEEQHDDEDRVALVLRDGGVHGVPVLGAGSRYAAVRLLDQRGLNQNCTRGGSAIAAASATSKNSRSVNPSPRTKSVFGKILILVLSSRTPPL